MRDWADMGGRLKGTMAVMGQLSRLAGDRLPEAGSEQLSQQQKIFEMAFLGLRQRRGVDLAAFAKKFRRTFDETFNGVAQEMERGGFLIRRGNALQLTRKGLYVCDEICARLEGQFGNPSKE